MLAGLGLGLVLKRVAAPQPQAVRLPAVLRQAQARQPEVAG
jgi:hypothetical protein